MEFWISKTFWALAAPSHFMVIGLVLGLLLPLGDIGKRAVMGFFAVLLLICMMLPVGDWALVPLERCEWQVQLPMQIDGAIALGGAIDQEATLASGQPQFNGAAERFTGLLQVMKNYPQAMLIYSGGAGSPKFPEFHEANYIRKAMEDIGFDGSRLIVENKSRNTLENVSFTQPYFSHSAQQNWVIITSAYHLPRALSLFREAGKASQTNFYAYPVDFQSPGRFQFEFTFDLPGNLGKLDTAAKEYVALAFNRLKGRTKKFMPCGEEKEKFE